MSTEHPEHPEPTESTAPLPSPGLAGPEPSPGPSPEPSPGPTFEPTFEPHTGDPSGRHPVEIGYLVMGLALLGLVAIWAVVQSDTVQGEDVRWLLPLPWVLAGAAGLVVTTLRGLRGHRDT